ncbi:MAG: serine/threonine protein kinase [Myxococcaceae bacterium]|nr:serine/threonine protein kinase [Myxococcaceae bacterium]
MTAASPAHPATRFLGRYELLYLLGQGGMGEVHLARLSGVAGFEKLCIVKTILPQMMTDPQFVDRFHHEARVLVQLNHSNIAQVYDMGDVEQTLYMAIEYVPGVDLARVEDRARAMDSAVPVPVALLIGQQMCEALGYAHRKVGADGAPLGIVHRDVSPQNVMVSYEGEVKVIDFGLAKSSARSKHTLPSTVLGKLGYMSPEQARAERVDHRSDIYSAGIVIWELLAGRPLINGGTVGEMVAMMANPKVPSLRDLRPEVSEAVEKLVLRALAPDPALRYSRADDFARAINEQLVREGLVVGSEDVGNYVRAMCPEEFAAERQLQSRLSGMRKKGTSSANVQPNKSPVPAPIEGTFLRAPASSAAAGVIQPTQVRTPLPKGSNPQAPVLTPAQRAMSTVFADTQTEEGHPAYAPGQQVGGEAARAPSNISVQPGVSQPALSGEYQVPKSKAPMVALSIVLLAAVGGGGFFAWRELGPGLLGGGGATEPLVVEPPPKKNDPLEVAKVDPPPKKDPEPEVAKKDPDPEVKQPEVAKQPENVAAPQKLERIEVKGQVWKIIKDRDEYYVVVQGKQTLEKGDEVKVLGPELEKAQREVYGVAMVVEVERSLARLLVDEETKIPPKAFAVKELGPKRTERLAVRQERKGQEVARVEPMKQAEPEPTKAEPTKTEPTKTEPAKVEPTKVEHPVRQQPEQVAQPAKSDDVRQKTLNGGITVSGQSKVYVFNRTDYAWHGCEIWLPTKKYFRYDPGAEISAQDSDKLEYGRFTEPKAVDPAVQRELDKGTWALVRCKEGAGYVSFKAK